MTLLTGKSESDIRAMVALANQRHGPLEKFFATAAEEHAPDLPRRVLERKLKRYRNGGAAPQFVKDHLCGILDTERRGSHPHG